MFIGFSSNLVIGVYVGFDNPKTLGRYETGSKAALPIFKDFVENGLFKDDFKDFSIPNNIYLTSINYDTGFLKVNRMPVKELPVPKPIERFFEELFNSLDCKI